MVMRWIQLLAGVAMLVSGFVIPHYLLTIFSDALTKDGQLNSFDVLLSVMTARGTVLAELAGIAGIAFISHSLYCWKGAPTRVLLLAIADRELPDAEIREGGGQD